MRQTIYLVEDHHMVRESYVMFLGMESDLEVVGTAGTAEKALEELVQAPPDLLLVDVSLPGMSGLELIEALQEREVLVPTLVLTAHDENRYRLRAEKVGARGFVMKEDGPDALLEAIRGVLPGPDSAAT